VTHYRLAVLGDPVSHSLSPTIHAALFDLAGLSGEYLAIRSDPPRLRSLLDELRGGEWDGFNVTMPLKGAAAAAADALTDVASRAGSVNTLVMRDGHVLGETTDSVAFRDLLADSRLAGRSAILVLGAGGSAAAALASISPDEDVYVASRRQDRAAELATRFGYGVVPWGSLVAGALLINATPLGMRGENLPPSLVESSSAVIDLPYGAKPTPTALRADELGVPLIEGREFLLRQAMASFTLWTGVAVAYERVATALRNV